MVFFNAFNAINHAYGADAVLIVNCSKCLCNAQFLNHCKRYNCDDPLITSIIVTPAVKNGEKHLVDYVSQPDGKSLGTPGQVI